MNKKATIWGALHYVVTGPKAEENAIAFYRAQGYTCTGTGAGHVRVLEDGKGHRAYMSLEAI